MLHADKVGIEAKKKEDENFKYPYTNQPERLYSLLGMLDTISICPVAFEIFERLKKEYGFKKR